MRLTVTAVVLCLGFAGSAQAQQQTVHILGAGLKSCGTFISASMDNKPGEHTVVDTKRGRFADEANGYQEWLMGFVTGFNFARSGTGDTQITGIDISGMDLWMRNWCNKNPTRSVLEGVTAFEREMVSR